MTSLVPLSDLVTLDTARRTTCISESSEVALVQFLNRGSEGTNSTVLACLPSRAEMELSAKRLDKMELDREKDRETIAKVREASAKDREANDMKNQIIMDLLLGLKARMDAFTPSMGEVSL